MNREFIFTDELKNRIFRHFEGMDKEYEGLIQGYHKAYLDDKYSDEHKNREKGLTVDRVQKLKKDRIDKAKTEIEKIKREYSIKPEPVKRTAEERTANLLLWDKVLPTATLQEMKQLWADNPADDDLKKLLIAELRERAAGSTPGPEVSRFLNELEHGAPDTRFKEMEKLIPAFNMLASVDNYPAMIEGSLNGIQYRDVAKDLMRFPLDNGVTFRPVFKVTPHNNNPVA